MPTDWQSIVALLAVAGAASFLVRRGLAMVRSGTRTGSACRSCGSCASGKSAAHGAPVVVALENFAPHKVQDEVLGVDLPKRDAPVT